MPRLALPATALTLALAAACSHGPGKRPYPAPTTVDLLARITATTDQVSSFYADDTTMDYWMGDERVKGTVAIMGTTGARVRINALSPAGGTTLSDLACDGRDYAFIDFNKNCQLTGPCSRDSIAAMLRVALTPDDLLTLAIGATPIIAGATGTVRWDGSAGKEVLELTGDGGRTQVIVLDARDGHADVVSSEVKTSDGVQEWRIDNTGFSTVKDASGAPRRVPVKSRFRSPGEKSDLIVEWNARQLGIELGDEKFQMELPPGLASCQPQAQVSAGQPAP
ncbi:MAG: hypothetical protein IPL61_34940 [Myxococcales bacterium]|nr:hypothetical protein [Myxococcales bacterium]